MFFIFYFIPKILLLFQWSSVWKTKLIFCDRISLYLGICIGYAFNTVLYVKNIGHVNLYIVVLTGIIFLSLQDVRVLPVKSTLFITVIYNIVFTGIKFLCFQDVSVLLVKESLSVLLVMQWIYGNYISLILFTGCNYVSLGKRGFFDTVII